MEGLFTIQNLAIIVALAVPPLIWCGCRIFAESDTIAEALWQAQHGKEDV